MAAAAGDLAAAAGVARRPVATGLREAGEATEEAVKAGGFREAVEGTEEAEATGPKGAWRAAEVATRLAAEVTLLAGAAGAARAVDEATVLREAVRAAEAGRAGVVLAVVGVGTAPAVGVVGTRGRSLGEGPPEDPGITPR